MKKTDISVIGLGKMGSALARTLLTRHKVTVWNRTLVKTETLVECGAHSTSSLLEAIQSSPVILICVTNYSLTKQLLNDSYISNHLDGRVIVQMSSGSPAETSDSEQWMVTHGAEYLDGAILGAPLDIGTDDGQILICGNQKAWQLSKPFLSCLAGNLQYLGENVRSASTLDLAWLTLRYGLFVSTAHALNLCAAEGVSAQDFGRTVASERAEIIADIVHSGDYSKPSATLTTWRAAHDHILHHARDANINSEFPDFISDLLIRAENSGYGNQDIASLFKVLNESCDNT